MSRRQIIAVLLLLSVGACVSDSSALESGGETETETGEDATPMPPSAEDCTLDLLWQAPPNSPWIFAGVRSGGFLIALTDTEAETVALSRHDAAGELVWTVDTLCDPPVGSDGDLLELGDGRIVLVSPQYLSSTVGWFGCIDLYTAMGQLDWWLNSDAMPWEVVGPQGDDGFACAGSFAWSWSDISGMSTCRYAGEGVSLQTAKEPETDQRIAALYGDDGRTWVVDKGCTVDELDSDTGLPTSWAACVGSSVHFWSLDRLAGGTLIAGGLLSTADDQRPYVHELGADGEPLASWTGAEVGSVSDLAPLPDGGVLLGGTSALWRLDAQLELVAECRLTLAGEPWDGFVKRVAVDEHGRVIAELRGTEFAGVVRVEGLIE